ncbi:hypothetical protein BH24ACT19_BH24ACT19_11030 [soil metagenome]|jgi:hypothetical protein
MLTMLAHPGVYLEPYEGGYVFARAFWEIYDTSPELSPEDFSHHTYLYAWGANEEVDEEMEPTIFELEAYVYAIESYPDHERYGLPYPGSSKDQPYVWKLALDCVTDAINAARTQAHAEARQNREE